MIFMHARNTLLVSSRGAEHHSIPTVNTIHDASRQDELLPESFIPLTPRALMSCASILPGMAESSLHSLHSSQPTCVPSKDIDVLPHSCHAVAKSCTWWRACHACVSVQLCPIPQNSRVLEQLVGFFCIHFCFVEPPCVDFIFCSK